MVIFNGDGIEGSISDLSYMFGSQGLSFTGFDTMYYLKSNAVLLFIAIIGVTPIARNTLLWLRKQKGLGYMLTFVEPLVCTVLLIVVTAYLIDGSFNPFLYFRF